jgi:hypothetical protein
MSSKSRHDRKSPNEAHAPIEHVDGGVAEAPSVEDFLGEDTIHVPEGRNRLQFVFLIGLLIFLLIIFIVPGAFQNSMTGDGRDSLPMVSWETDAGIASMDLLDFQMEKRAEAAALSLRGVRITPSDEEIATILLTDALAVEAGVVVPDAQVKENLRQVAEILGGLDRYKAVMQSQFSGGAPTFERIFRRGIRISNYLGMLSRIAIAPPTGLLEVEWDKTHELVAFNYISADVEVFKDAALAEAPDSATLETWLNARPAYEINTYKTLEKWTLGSAFFRNGGEAPQALADAYPLPEDWDAEAEATRYYQTYSYLAFKRDEEITDENGEVSRYIPQEEVDEECRKRAAILTSMKAWREDAAGRMEAGEAVDLALEAQTLGLGWHESDAAMDRSEILGDNEFGGGILSSQLLSIEPGQLIGTTIVGKQTMQVAKVLSRLEPALPEFSTISDDVAKVWAAERAGGLAVEALEALTSSETLTEEEFTALAAGDERFSMGTRDWLDRSGSFMDDPNNELPANRFIGIQTYSLGLDDMEEGELAPATLASGSEAAYLVRCMGKKPVAFSTANPGQLQTVSTAVDIRARTTFLQAFSSTDGELPAYLVNRYKLRLPANEKADADRAMEDAEQGEG